MERSYGILEADAIDKPLTAVFPDLEIPLRPLEAIDDALGIGSSSVLSEIFTPHPLHLVQPQDTATLAVQSVTIQALRDSNGSRHCLLGIQEVTHADQREGLMHEMHELVKLMAAELESLNKDLQTTNEELDAFAPDPAHDLRGPPESLRLNWSAGWVCRDLCADRSEELEPDVAKDLEQIESVVGRMAALIRSLLLLAKAGKSAIESRALP